MDTRLDRESIKAQVDRDLALLRPSPWRRLKRWLGLHDWHYRNPADRTCLMCDRREQQYCQVINDNNPLSPRNPSWWEVVEEGDGRCRNASRTPCA